MCHRKQAFLPTVACVLRKKHLHVILCVLVTFIRTIDCTDFKECESFSDTYVGWFPLCDLKLT